MKSGLVQMSEVSADFTESEKPGSIDSLEEQRNAFSSRRFLATPLAGMIVWLLIAVSATLFSPQVVVWITFLGTGSIVYLSMVLSLFTGEQYFTSRKKANEFDSLFLHAMAASMVIFAIAIPFFIIDYTSLPLTLGVLTGTMWIPFSWIIRHPAGIYHCVVRTALIVPAWYLFPSLRFVVIPLIIVLVYLLTIIFLETRWRNLSEPAEANL